MIQVGDTVCWLDGDISAEVLQSVGVGQVELINGATYCVNREGDKTGLSVVLEAEDVYKWSSDTTQLLGKLAWNDFWHAVTDKSIRRKLAKYASTK